MTESFYLFDPANMLDSAEMIQLFLREALEVSDPTYIAAVLQVVARAKGLEELASMTSYTREQVSAAFTASDNLSSSHAIAILDKLGLALPPPQRLRNG